MSKRIGLDCGTAFLYAYIEEDKETKESKIRNAFIEIEEEEAEVLKLSNMGSIMMPNGMTIVVGDDAVSLASLIKTKKLQRPMKAGLMAADEVVNAIDIMTVMIKGLIGEGKNGDVVFFSVPAKPIDADRSLVYHTKVIEKALNALGYIAVARNEAHAIALSELGDNLFTGLTWSCGAGMQNICLSYKSMNTMEFAISKSGDYIDESVNSDLNVGISKIIKIKEKELDISDPSKGKPKNFRIREALTFYYRQLIEDTLKQVANHIKQTESAVELDDPIPLVLSGGTSMVNGFVQFFEDIFSKMDNFPIEISEIRHASSPLAAVAKGLLIGAKNYRVSTNAETPKKVETKKEVKGETNNGKAEETKDSDYK